MSEPDETVTIPTRNLLLALERRGAREDYYSDLGTDMAIGARNLLDSLPGSMLEATEETDEPR